MPTLSISIPATGPNQEILIAFLDDYSVEGFQETAESLIVFVDQSNADALRLALQTSLAGYISASPTEEEIQDRNWNEEWEKTIDSIRAGGFWIRPTWNKSSAPPDHIEVIVDPKMSFGTGYHESTRLMLGGIQEFTSVGDSVLDAGTGTGVLAIAALLKGAKSADAFDFDPICKENADENASLNGLKDDLRVYEGSESVIPGEDYDLILANINREALRGMLPELTSRLAPNGKIGLSGLLYTDREIMLGTLRECALLNIREYRERNWWSVWARHDV